MKPASPANAEPRPLFASDYLPALLAQASELISHEFHRVVLSKGFTVTEWRVLASLSNAVALSIGQIARLSVTTQPTVTRVIDKLEARGDVRRLPGPGDRRITMVEITPAGREMVAELIDLARQNEQRVLLPFGEQRSAELKAALQQIIALHSGETPPAQARD
jgi:DNA-binding MarR family transcriptional regulator